METNTVILLIVGSIMVLAMTHYGWDMYKFFKKRRDAKEERDAEKTRPRAVRNAYVYRVYVKDGEPGAHLEVIADSFDFKKQADESFGYLNMFLNGYTVAFFLADVLYLERGKQHNTAGKEECGVDTQTSETK